MAATADAHAPVPEAVVGPTPRSQIRMRTRSGASTRANSTLVPAGNRGCVASAGPETIEARLVGQFRDERHALWIAHPQRRHVNRLVADDERFGANVFGRAHRRAKRQPAAVPAHQRQRFPARIGVDADLIERGLAVRGPVAVHDQRGETTQAVAGKLRWAAVGVVQGHPRRAVGRRRVQNQPVAADARVTGAAGAGERRRIQTLGVVARNEQEVVSVSVRLDQRQLSHHGKRKALSTQVKPAVTPNCGSRDVIPRITAPSSRTGPRV